MSDVLSISVPIVGRYASVNNVGRNSHRAGKKSPAYHALFKAVKEAAEAEIARTGWTTAAENCLAIIVRYVPDNRRCDALNMGKCEWDALTAAGVWDDDRWANPSLPWIVPNAGEHRVAIAVVRLHAPQQRQSVPADVGRRHSDASSVVMPGTAAGGTTAAKPRTALLNGKPISMAEALKMVRGG